MTQKRKTHSETFKARVAVEAIKGVQTLSELSAAHGVHPTVIAHWKRQLLEGAPEVFRRGPGVDKGQVLQSHIKPKRMCRMTRGRNAGGSRT